MSFDISEQDDDVFDDDPLCNEYDNTSVMFEKELN